MSSPAVTGISISVDQNPYLAEGVRTVDAVISVETTDELMVAAPRPSGSRS